MQLIISVDLRSSGLLCSMK